MAGGTFTDGVYHDTHAHPLTQAPLALLTRILRRTGPVPVLLERDRDFGKRTDLEAELDALGHVVSSAFGHERQVQRHAL